MWFWGTLASAGMLAVVTGVLSEIIFLSHNRTTSKDVLLSGARVAPTLRARTVPLHSYVCSCHYTFEDVSDRLLQSYSALFIV